MTNKLAFEIETNRQRLQYAIETRNEELTERINRLLIELLAAYFDLTKGEQMKQLTKSYLVFSEANVDGARMTETEYRQLVRTMTREDRETHQAIEIARGAESFADAMIDELKSVSGQAEVKRKRA